MTSEIIDISKQQKPNWLIITVLTLLHLGAVAALFMFNWRAFASAVFLMWVATGLGISLGYHRLHTHRSYKVPLWLEYFFALCGTLTLEGGPIFWVATHRIHHQKSDQPGDPHSPRDGAWWSHITWILVGESKHNNTKLMARFFQLNRKNAAIAPTWSKANVRVVGQFNFWRLDKLMMSVVTQSPGGKIFFSVAGICGLDLSTSPIFSLTMDNLPVPWTTK